MKKIIVEDIKASVKDGKKERIILLLNGKIEISEGDVVGIIGENGSGKTTFINCLLNEFPFKGKIISDFKRKEIGVQFQNNSLNDLMKVKELIEIVLNCSINSEKCKTLIEKFSLAGILNNRLNKLSGGEKQRLVLALVMFFDSKLFIFDEITTGLDFEKREDILLRIKHETKGKTILIVTHYFTELENWANKVLCLYRGKSLFFGEIETLFDSCPYKVFLHIKKEDFLLKNDYGSKLLKKDEFGNLFLGFNNEMLCNEFIKLNDLHEKDYKKSTISLENAYMYLTSGGQNA